MRTAQPVLEEKQLMLVSALAQQSCFTARNYFVQPQLIHSCCVCWRWVPAAAQVLTLCSDPSGAEPRAGAQEETRVERTSHGQWPNWSPVQRISSALAVAVFQFRLPGLRQYRPTAVPSHNCSAWGCEGEPWITPLPSYWNLTGAKRQLGEGSQALDEVPAHPCLSGSQISWCFLAGKTEHWSSHCQNYSGNSVADSGCFYSPSNTPKYNGMLLWTFQIQKILVIWIFSTSIISCQKVDFYTMKTIHLT